MRDLAKQVPRFLEMIGTMAKENHLYIVAGSIPVFDEAKKTLADVIVDPAMQGHGIGKALYAARRHLVERLGLFRIRAGSRLQGYHQFATTMSAEEYVFRIVQGELEDPTLSFQLHQGFHVLAVVNGYLHHDPKSLGYAAVIEWVNERAAKPEDYSQRGTWISKQL